MIDNGDYFMAGIGLISGVGLFFGGFKLFRKKQLVDNIPTSTVRGMAMGLVELTGRPRREPYLKGPFSGEDCVIYSYKIERYERRGKSSQWVTIASGDSFHCSFELEDDTGRVMVIPSGAEFISDAAYAFQTSWGQSLPGNLVTFMEGGGIRYFGLFGNHTLRFTERHISPDEPIYVLGTSKKINAPLEDAAEYKNKLMKRLNMIKDDGAQMAMADHNKDGNISEDEWNAVVAKVEQDLLQKEIASAAMSGLPDVAIGRGDDEQTFIISDKSQKDLNGLLGWQVFGGVIGGAVLTVGCLWYLLVRFGIF